MVNIEKGIKRVVWIVSLTGVLIALIGLGFGIYNEVTRLILLGRVPNTDFLPSALRQQVVDYINTTYSLDGFYAVPIGAGWFLIVWGVFFMSRWIVRGFLDKK